ncbi:2'-5' RNA ligase family protein [Streptomyces sp. NPDC005407]|uniref:2'-5' RNA ligase family protein n=1 Tax=Streptomyces sp. NPDC005407 TaxID=3155340 RepID=UPI0033B13EE8
MQLLADPTAFPPDPPSDPDDAPAIVAHDWEAFNAVEEMNNHWNRPGWANNTRAYYWMLTFPGARALIDQTRQCQGALSHLRLDNVDDDGLHVTLGRIARVGEASHEQLKGLAATAAKSMPDAFTFHAIPLTASRGAIRYSIAPWTTILTVHATLTAAGANSGLPMSKPTSILRPHLGIAYCNRSMPARIVRDAVQPLRDLEPVEVPVRHVQLVELRRENHAYRWNVVHSLALR